MLRYTLKVFYGSEQIERFDHRNTAKLKGILAHPEYNMAGQTGPFGEIIKHPDTFEVYNSSMVKIFHGNIKEAQQFVRDL